MRVYSARTKEGERGGERGATRPRYEMNEFSCYDCMKPIKTERQLNNHMNGRDHRNVVDYRTRTEKGYVPDRGRSYYGAPLPSRQHGEDRAPEHERFAGDKPSAVSMPTRKYQTQATVSQRALEAPLVPKSKRGSGVGSEWLKSLVPQQVIEGSVPSFLQTIAGDIESAKDLWM